MRVIVAALAVVGGVCSPVLAGEEATPRTAVIGIVDLALLIACPCVLTWLWRKDVIRPGSFRRAPGRDLSRTPWAVWWVGALLMLMAQGAGGAMGLVLVEGRGQAWRDVGGALGGGIGSLAIGAWLVWLLRTGPGGATAGMSLRMRARDFGTGALGFLLSLPIVGAVTMASVLIVQVITGRETDPLAHETLKVIDEAPWSLPSWGLIIGAVIVVPVVEEVLFRGMVQSGFLRLSRRVWVSVLVASGVFAAVHLGSVGKSVHALAPLFAFGVCLGVAYERTQRLWVPITMHAAFNALNIGVVLAGV